MKKSLFLLLYANSSKRVQVNKKTELTAAMVKRNAKKTPSSKLSVHRTRNASSRDISGITIEKTVLFLCRLTKTISCTLLPTFISLIVNIRDLERSVKEITAIIFVLYFFLVVLENLFKGERIKRSIFFIAIVFLITNSYAFFRISFEAAVNAGEGLFVFKYVYNACMLSLICLIPNLMSIYWDIGPQTYMLVFAFFTFFRVYLNHMTENVVFTNKCFLRIMYPMFSLYFCYMYDERENKKILYGSYYILYYIYTISYNLSIIFRVLANIA